MLVVPCCIAVNAQRTVISFDKGWKFFEGDLKSGELVKFDDTYWRKLDVPHDWSIEGNYDRANKTGRGGGYLPNGIGWYRKQFTLPEGLAAQQIAIEFDGIMANSDVWINGHHLGHRPFGYVTIFYDVTPYLNWGKGTKNTIAVKADNSLQPASRWYSGAGIYRHTRLIATHPIAILPNGIFVTTPQVSPNKATVQVEVAVGNITAKQTPIILESSIIDATGKVVSSTKNSLVIGAKNVTSKQSIAVSNPTNWHIDKPYLYKAITKIWFGNKVLDQVETLFGIRTFRFDAASGFYLNDKAIKLKGICLHHDGGAVGAAVPLRIWEKRLQMLKEVGANAIRTAHNPMAPEFLDLCDKMGFLVMNETFDTWTAKKSNADYGYNLYFNDWWQRDTRDIVLRDRNHPSIILYSIGNEIRDNLKDSSGFKKYRDQQNLVHDLDGTRPVTMAIFRPNDAGVYNNGFVEIMDIVGQNYRENELVALHNAKPQLSVIGTENGHTRDAWLVLRDNPYMAGQFLWTGVDYLGEADWPNIGSSQGVIDRLGNPKPRTYERQSWWSDKPMVHIVRSAGNAGTGALVSDWTPADADTYDEANVQVYSNCDEVELFLNGKSLGSKTKPVDDAPRNWKATFERGTIKAVAKNKGTIVATHLLQTAEAASKIMLSVDKSTLANNFDDVVFVKATITDANGTRVPSSDETVTFSISGPGIITAIDNANIASHERYKSNQRQAFNGEVSAIIKATGPAGKIIIAATVKGLGKTSVHVNAIERKQ